MICLDGGIGDRADVAASVMGRGCSSALLLEQGPRCGVHSVRLLRHMGKLGMKGKNLQTFSFPVRPGGATMAAPDGHRRGGQCTIAKPLEQGGDE